MVGRCCVVHADKTTQPNNLRTDSFYREVGLKIREARDQKKLTQEDLAQTVGLTRTSLTNIEKGRQKFLLHTFVAIASALEVTPAKLLPGANEVLQKLGVELPASLPPEELDFIARAVSPRNDT